MRIFFTVPGKPRGKARPRAMARITWPHGPDGDPVAISTVYSDPEMVELEADIARRFQAAAGASYKIQTGPIKLNILAVFPMPQSFKPATVALAKQGKVWHRGTPDLDNIEKLIADALNRLAWVDDGQIAVVTKGKRYGSPERLEVTVEALPQEPGTRTPNQAELERRIAIDGLESVFPAKRGKSKKTKKEPSTPMERMIAAADERDKALRREEWKRRNLGAGQGEG